MENNLIWIILFLSKWLVFIVPFLLDWAITRIKTKIEDIYALKKLERKEYDLIKHRILSNWDWGLIKEVTFTFLLKLYYS